MRVTQVLVSLVVAINARPDASHLLPDAYLPPSEESNNKQHQIEDEQHLYYYGSSNRSSDTPYYINLPSTSKKNVIFVTAPHQGGDPEVVAPPFLVEDKTQVYVLLKKPAELQSVSIPANITVKQIKSEVFLIMYNNKQEAGAQVSEAVRSQGVGETVQEILTQKALVTDHEEGDQNEHAPVSVEDGVGDVNLATNDMQTQVQIADETIPEEKDVMPEISIEALKPENATDIQPQTVVITENGENTDDNNSTVVETISNRKKK